MIGSGASQRGDPLALPHTDWLRHLLIVTGPTEDVATFQSAAVGPGAIPWVSPDLDLLEEDRVMALVHPPDGSAGLSLAGARALARQLRNAIETNQQRVAAAVGRVRACPFDLHALLPVPDPILERGEDSPTAKTWLWTHWGTTQPLRQVRIVDDQADRRLRRAARTQFEFRSADWTPWQAISRLRRDWPMLIFDIRPHYDDA